MIKIGICVALLAICVSGCGRRDEAGRDGRSAASERVAVALMEEARWELRRQKDGERATLEVVGKKAAGEDVAELTDWLLAKSIEMNRTRPDFRPVVADAVAIIDGNSRDDAAYRALTAIVYGTSRNRIQLIEGTPRDQEVALSDWAKTAAGKLHDRAGDLLLEFHVERPDFWIPANDLMFESSEKGARFWDEVARRTKVSELRFNALAMASKYKMITINNADVAQDVRKKLRADVERDMLALSTEFPEGSSNTLERLKADLAYSPGAMMPDVEVSRLAGGRARLADYRGKVVLLDFWATWCGGCKLDAPLLQRFSEEADGGHFRLISLSADDTPEIAREYVTRNGYSWEQWFVGPDNKAEWGVAGYPTYMVISPEGELLAKFHDFRDPKGTAYIKSVIAKVSSD